MKIDLCIATFRRPMLADTLASLGNARIPPGTALRVIVVDNDHTPSARANAEAAGQQAGLTLSYVHAPAANISLARNAGLEAARADWIAFLDDDEIVTADWLAELVRCAKKTGADAVFGPSEPIYPPGTPDWIAQGAFHRQSVPLRGGRAETGHTCNALVRMGGTPWAAQRFDLSLGQSGGEDTQFFAALFAQGARFHVTGTAAVREIVTPDRLTFRWLAQRRFRIGQTYGALAQGVAAKSLRFGLAAAKAGYCAAGAALCLHNAVARNGWALRGVMHWGVCAGCLPHRKPALYGASEPAAD